MEKLNCYWFEGKLVIVCCTLPHFSIGIVYTRCPLLFCFVQGEHADNLVSRRQLNAQRYFLLGLPFLDTVY